MSSGATSLGGVGIETLREGWVEGWELVYGSGSGCVEM